MRRIRLTRLDQKRSGAAELRFGEISANAAETRYGDKLLTH